MSLTKREQQLYEELLRWEEEWFVDNDSPASLTYQSWLSKTMSSFEGKWKNKVLKIVDEGLFQIQASMQQSKFDKQAVDHILTTARAFQEDVQTVNDMKKLRIDQLKMIADKSLAKQRLLSLGQGGASGIGGPLFLAADLPTLMAVNIRAIQLVATTYGFDLRKPYEMMLVLKLFHVASLPRPLQRSEWLYLEKEVQGFDDDWYFYEGKEQVISFDWLHQPAKQLLKVSLLSLLRKKSTQTIPVLGAFIGAGMNYRFTEQVTTIAHHFYQNRFIQEKQISNG
ncbi:EcsC family protein [Texcoconibacillus texcoconensis]|uniref:EcsC family protein n=1 Tax=Texcoconibacillus texcoconensis TaxID=1095777 RepID=A0A840QN02_9BACI|nr:EcsC family protein [Texcoconibacillus texcoconensis]MBB5172746.1 hypothetical protein [Texcoconibacillus texcoconensis]